MSAIFSHALTITDPKTTLAFYTKTLGMQHVCTKVAKSNTTKHYYLAYPRSGTQPQTYLELVHPNPEEPITHNDNGYWKIGITVLNLSAVHERLQTNRASISTPQQFMQVGYLCHLSDPLGYSIELFERKRANIPISNINDAKPTLAHLTLRITNPQTSLAFYKECLGFKLLSTQIIKEHGFTLYFLALTNERSPEQDPEQKNNEQSNHTWLWQRPYSLLELQHRWNAPAKVSNQEGFRAISILAGGQFYALVQKLQTQSAPILGTSENPIRGFSTIRCQDPDGYCIDIINADKIML